MKRLLFLLVALTISVQSFAALTWTVGPEIMPGAGNLQFYQMGGAAELNGKMYIFGGNTANGDDRKMYFTTLGLGTVSAFTTCTYTMPDGATPGQADWCYNERKTLSYNGRMYIVGGNNNGSDPERNQVTIITPQPGGDIANATDFNVTNATGNSIARLESAAVVNPATGKLYVIGGGPGTQIDVAQISSVDGTVGAFSTAGALPASLDFHGAVILGGRLYVIGGWNGSASVTTVQHTTFNGDGTIGAWTTDTSLPEGRYDGMALVYKGKIWYIGGTVTGNPTTRNTALLATVDGSGNITGWTTDSTMVLKSSQTGTGGYPDFTGPTTGIRRITGVATDTNGIFIPGGRIDSTTWTGFVFIGRDLTDVETWSLY
jgi:hypothetical protein